MGWLAGRQRVEGSGLAGAGGGVEGGGGGVVDWGRRGSNSPFLTSFDI